MWKEIKNLPLAIFCLYAIKLTILSGNMPDVGALFVLSLISIGLNYEVKKNAYNEFEEKFKQIQQLTKKFETDIDKIKTHHAAQQMSNNNIRSMLK